MAARQRQYELCGDKGPLINDLRIAQELIALVEDAAGWEIITVSKDLSNRTPLTLGFDLGWWGDDFYSLISDCVVAPKWHGPDLSGLTDLAPAAPWA